MPARAPLIMGHFAYSSISHAYDDARLVTVLREPFCRLFSHWLFWRQHSDEQLAPWGLWADRVRTARRPLADFLSSPTVACQTDNIVVRMLLWPHPLVPDDDFINPVHDAALIQEARVRLGKFAHVDVIENPDLVGSLGAFIGRSVDYDRVNGTGAPPDEFRCDLDENLGRDSWELLAQRSRLDLRLWGDTVACNMPGVRTHVLRDAVLNANLNKYRDLLRGAKTH